MKNRVCFIICTVVLLLFFTSCATEYTDNDDFYGGESLNAEILSEIAESIFYESQSSAENDIQNDSNISSEHNGIFYWTDGGRVYHKWSDCGHLKKSSDVKSGSEQDALLAGKEALCSSCAKKDN